MGANIDDVHKMGKLLFGCFVVVDLGIKILV
jgi:hypothetical protein